MPSDRKQFNVRLSNKTFDDLYHLRAAMIEQLGQPDLSFSDIVSMALSRLMKEYMPPAAEDGRRGKPAAG
jgi:hypothetical protein